MFLQWPRMDKPNANMTENKILLHALKGRVSGRRFTQAQSATPPLDAATSYQPDLKAMLTHKICNISGFIIIIIIRSSRRRDVSLLLFQWMCFFF